MARVSKVFVGVPGPPGTGMSKTDADTYYVPKPAIAGTEGQELAIVSGAPAWRDTPAAGGTPNNWPEIIVDVTADGTTDNLAMIQNAINDAATMVGDRYGRTVVLNATGDVGVSGRVVVPKGVHVSGRGARATRLFALPAYAGGYVLQMGDETREAEHLIRVTDMIIDSGDQVGVGGIYTRTANEPSAIERVLFRNIRARAVHMTYSTTPSLISSHMAIRDCEVFNSITHEAVPTFDFDNVGNTVLIERTTISVIDDAKTLGTRSPVAVKGDNSAITMIDCHIEQHVAGTNAVYGSGSRGRLEVLGLTGHPSVDDLIQISDIAPHELMGLSGLGTVNLINNTHLGETITTRTQHYSNHPQRGTSRQVGVVTTTGMTLTILHDVVRADSTAAQAHILLPTDAPVTGHEFVIKKVDASANTVRVNPLGTVTIDGVSEKLIGSQHGYIRCVFDGANYIVTGQSGTITDVP